MKNFLEGIDLSGLKDAPKQIAELLKEGASTTLENIKAQSGPIAEAAEKTVAIGNDALKKVLNKTLDSEGAFQIVRRSGEQLEDLARAEGNLILSNSVSFLKKIGQAAVKLVPGFFGM